ncbi:MAG: M23 family metallopeptidase [Chlorobium sp.]|nr:M23 family metallopeptidase [Chlorobium sp.]MCW8815642.1 M23 family metallopeptidase [Chlorobium sp.]MCW8819652.1 M23 family metallopeptidase [Ignavibacteriaceae bacterium]
MLSRKGFYFLTEDSKFIPLHYLKIMLAGCVVAILVASAAIVVSSTLNPAKSSEQSSHRNSLLTLQKKINTLEEQLASLSASDNQLRLAVNLPVVSQEEKTMGTGGQRSRTLYADQESSAHLLAMTGKKIENLSLKIEQQKKSHKDIQATWNKNQALFAAVPALKPIDGKITSTFGKRRHPIYKRVLFHEGIDFSAKTGTNIYAPGNGVVIFTGYHFGYGKKIVIDHGFGYKTVYAHLSRSLVHKGQKVTRGDIIALSGNTGISTGPHLHYEVHKYNRKVNPSAYFFDDFTPESYLTGAPVSKQSDSNS